MSNTGATDRRRRDWRVSAAVPLRVRMAGEPDEHGGLPEKLEAVPHITDCQRTVASGVGVGARPWPDPQFPTDPMALTEWVEFFADVENEDAFAAAEQGAAAIGVVLDGLSFRMGGLLRVALLEAIDVTAPVAVGDQRNRTRTVTQVGDSRFHMRWVTSPSSKGSRSDRRTRPSVAARVARRTGT